MAKRSIVSLSVARLASSRSLTHWDLARANIAEILRPIQKFAPWASASLDFQGQWAGYFLVHISLHTAQIPR